MNSSAFYELVESYTIQQRNKIRAYPKTVKSENSFIQGGPFSPCYVLHWVNIELQPKT